MSCIISAPANHLHNQRCCRLAIERGVLCQSTPWGEICSVLHFVCRDTELPSASSFCPVPLCSYRRVLCVRDRAESRVCVGVCVYVSVCDRSLACQTSLPACHPFPGVSERWRDSQRIPALRSPSGLQAGLARVPRGAKRGAPPSFAFHASAPRQFPTAPFPKQQGKCSHLSVPLTYPKTRRGGVEEGIGAL